MKSTFMYTAVASSILSLAACNQTSQPGAELTEAAATAGAEETIRSFSGTYSGTLPCASCPGIETSLTFNENGTVTKTTRYQETDDKGETREGCWLQEEKNVLQLSFPADTAIEFFQIQTDTTLTMLTPDKKEAEGTPAPHYILTKKKD